MNIFKAFYNHILDFWRDNDKSSIVFALIVFWQLLGFLPSIPSNFVYLALILYAVYSLKSTRSINFIYALFLLYIPIELIIANPPALFRSWERYAMFILVLCCFSPMLKGDTLSYRHKVIFEYILGISTFIGVGSFFAWFLGINYMFANAIDFINHVGTFGGLTSHSMQLGPFAGIGTVYTCYKAIETKNKYYWALCAMCMGSVLFAASRSSFIAIIAGLCVLLLRVADTGKSFRIIVSIVLVLAVSSPIWISSLNGLINKNLGSSQSIDISSRESKWDARIAEFESDPLFGVGFASVNSKNTSDYVAETGGIEPGSSWLAVLSMTGIIGFAFVALMIYRALINVWRAHTPRSALLLAILILFMVHMIAEGYIYFGGSVLCMALWLTLACATEYNEALWDDTEDSPEDTNIE